MQVGETKVISPEFVSAIILRSALKTPADKTDLLNLSKKMIKLQEKNIDTGYMAIRRVPGGYYSRDIAQFVSRLFAFGFVRERSPEIEITNEGIKVLDKKILDAFKENPNQVKRIAKILELNLDSIMKN